MNPILSNLLLGISLAAPLGPSGVAVIQNGLRHGFGRAFLTGLGVTLADATFLLAVYFGLSGFMDTPAARNLVWAFGALVLLYLGIQSIREALRGIDLEASTASTARNPLLVGYLVNISNPLSVVWWLGIFGSLLGASAGQAAKLEVLLLSGAILAGILLWHTSTSALTHWGKRYLNATTAKYVSLAAGAALILFGIRFAYNLVSSLT
jgi:threonine/homoserine/homoserine lactone efflux protein